MTWLTRTVTVRCRIVMSAAAVLATASPAAAQERDAGDALSQEAKRARQGAGIEAGAWLAQDLPDVAGAEYGTWPRFGGYFQKGLDLHLALVSSIGLWRREQVSEQSGITGTTRDAITTYIIPLNTAVRFYPTRPASVVEPYLQAGVGFALGIDDRESSGAGGLGFGFSSGTAMLAGFGAEGAAGLVFRLSGALGLAAGGRYQWIRFSQEVGGARTYKGFGAHGGLTYRFQYR